MPLRKMLLTALLAFAGIFSVAPAQAQAPTNAVSFAGKTITLMCHVPPGGGYDAYVRLLARHMGEYLPGKPVMIVVNKPGAGGAVAANHAASIAPRDGTFMLLMQQSMTVDEAMGKSAVQTSLRDFNWIGNFSQSNTLVATWFTSKTKTILDAQSRETLVGASQPGSTAGQLPLYLNALVGTRFKVVHGYEGGAAIDLAMQRGEVEGRGSNTWAIYKSTNAEFVRDKKLNFLVQVGLRKEPDLPDVPLLNDLAKGDPTKEQAARFISLGLSIARPLTAPPGVSPEIVQVLRRAFDKTMTDKPFLEEAAKLGLEVDPMTGEDVQAGVNQILATSPDVIEMLRKVMAAAPK